MFRSVEQLFRPRSIAIVGASDSGAGGWPRAIYGNLEHAGFPVPVYLINPRRDRLWDREVYPSFASLPEPVDLALTLIPAESVVDTLADGHANGLKAALVFAARFGEGGDEAGGVRSRQLAELCDEGLRVCGPNCMGALALPESHLFYPAERVRTLPRGGVGVIFQSGGTFQYWLSQGAVRGLGFSYAVSSGNELDLDVADYIAFLVDDPGTRVIACMLEGIRRPEAFMAACARALAAGKPVVALKTGASERGRSATESHTGAVAGDDDIFNAVCERYGIVRCHGLDDLIETTLMFSTVRLPKGSRVAFAGYSGGATGLFLDYASEVGPAGRGVERGDEDRDRAASGPGTPTVQPARRRRRPRRPAGRFQENLRGDRGRSPGRHPFDAGPAAGCGRRPGGPGNVRRRDARRDLRRRARAHGPERNRCRTRLPAGGRRSLPAGTAGDGARAEVPGALCRTQAPRRACGARVGIPEPGNRRGTARRARESRSRGAGSALTPPRRPESPTASAIRWRSRSSRPRPSTRPRSVGVALGLGDAASVLRTAGEMEARLRRAEPGADIEGFLVQEMVDGVEMFVGLRDDPQFGPFIVAGLGGIHVEALGDLAFRLLPIDETEAREMLDSLRGRVLLGPFRGRRARDVDALVRAMRAAGNVYLGVRDRFADIEINPLIALAEGEGVRAVDIRETPRK